MSYNEENVAVDNQISGVDKVTEIFMERLLSDIENSGILPWERPFNSIYSFNYFTMHEYTGINRWILPPGEYLTANQINQYNRQSGKNYKFAKGIKWYPVFYVKDVETRISPADLPDDIAGSFTGEDGYIGRDLYSYYICRDGAVYRVKKVRRFYQVADRQFFVDEEGNPLPSKIETGDVVLTFTKPQEIFTNYIQREGIHVTEELDGCWYLADTDQLNLVPLRYFNSQEHYYSTAFHEAAHSTGHDSRLCRVGVAVSKRAEEKEHNKEKGTRKYTYSKEECVAEFCSALLCSEAGFQMQTTCDDAYKNHMAYIKSWIKYFKENKKDIIYVMSCAEKAAKYILGTKQFSEEGSAPMRKE